MTKYPHIVKTPGSLGGKARIDGHRIRVQDVAIWVEQGGMTPDQVADEYDLTLGEVHAALAYYYDNIDEIKAEIREGDRLVEELKKTHPSRLSEIRNQRHSA